MKKLLAGMLLLSGSLMAQIEFERNFIADVDLIGFDIRAADLDGDGDLDIFYCDEQGDRVSWHENLDGLGSFGPAQLIADAVNSPTMVHAVDVDGDNDMDVIVSASNDGQVNWYENLDGNGNFGTLNLILELYSVAAISAVDLDGDNDPDLIAGSLNAGEVVWVENEQGGLFSTVHVLSGVDTKVYAIQVDDLDGDNDMDVVIGREDRISWFENLDGSGNFSVEQLILTHQEASDISLVDIDSDNDLDIIANSWNGDVSLIWLENLDGNALFEDPIIISEDWPNIPTLDTPDINNDGYPDIIIADHNLFELTYFPNLSGQGFGQEVTIHTQRQFFSINSADIDDDGFVDLLAGDLMQVAWYANKGGTFGFDDFNNAIGIYPNPTRGSLNIQSDAPIKSMELYDMQGKFIGVSENTNGIDLSSMQDGMYFLVVKDQNDSLTRMRVVKY